MDIGRCCNDTSALSFITTWPKTLRVLLLSSTAWKWETIQEQWLSFETYKKEIPISKNTTSWESPFCFLFLVTFFLSRTKCIWWNGSKVTQLSKFDGMSWYQLKKYVLEKVFIIYSFDSNFRSFFFEFCYQNTACFLSYSLQYQNCTICFNNNNNNTAMK